MKSGIEFATPLPLGLSKVSESSLTVAAAIIQQADILTNLDRRDAFLTFAGFKPVSTVDVNPERHLGDGLYTYSPGQLQSLRDIFGRLQMHQVVDPNDYCNSWDTLQVSISRSGALLGALRNARQAKDDYSIGRLYGYPETAVRAYVDQTMLSWDEQVRYCDIFYSGIPEFYVGFRLSREHYRDEIFEVNRWYQLLAQYGFF